MYVFMISWPPPPRSSIELKSKRMAVNRLRMTQTSCIPTVTTSSSPSIMGTDSLLLKFITMSFFPIDLMIVVRTQQNERFLFLTQKRADSLSRFTDFHGSGYLPLFSSTTCTFDGWEQVTQPMFNPTKQPKQIHTCNNFLNTSVI